MADFCSAVDTNECTRLCSVLDNHLADRDYIAGSEYSMADICIFPWLLYAESNGTDKTEFPNLYRWFRMIDARPAVRRLGERTWDTYDYGASMPVDDAARKILFSRTR